MSGTETINNEITEVKEEIVEDTVEATKTSAKRGRKSNAEKAATENAETEVVKTPAKRGRKSNAEKAAMAAETAKTPAKRGRKSKAEKAAMAAEAAKTPAKRGRKSNAEKAAMAADKKTEEAVKTKVVLQFEFGQYNSDEIIDKCMKVYQAENNTTIDTIDVYVKPADKKAYYVVNGESAGSVDL